MKPKILIVLADYYKEISVEMLDSTTDHIDKKSKFNLIRVPGVFEIPVVISKNIKKYDGFIALGCVIKGETPHFDFISQATTNAIMQLSIDYKKPIGNGIITALNKDQASNRSIKKGEEAAAAVFSVLSK
jgi:6,7-dimethyl-8-ribityllumazine synthase